MEGSTREGVRQRNNGERDMISELPDDVLHIIISLLSVDEAVRSSILSKRWESLWKHASHLDFDWKHMIRPLSQIQNSSSGKETFGSNIKAKERGAGQYCTLIDNVLHHLLGELTSCCFKHSYSLSHGEFESCIKSVLEKHKKLSSLSLECEPLILKGRRISFNASPKPQFQSGVFSNLCSLELTDYVLDDSAPSAFDGCAKLKTLKLQKMRMEENTINGILRNCLNLEKLILIKSTRFRKLVIQNPRLKILDLQLLIVLEIEFIVESLEVVMIESLFCEAKGVKIYAPNLKTFQYRCDSTAKKMGTNCESIHLLKAQEILENCSNHFESHNSINIFRNLLTLSIELDLNNIREALALAFVLKSCINLETLEITIPVEESSCFNRVSSDDSALPFPKSMFWERREMCNCINHTLKLVKIRGFKGKEQEVNFAKHLITRATVMQRISIICDSLVVEEAIRMLSLPRASVYLSVILKSENKDHNSE